MNQAEPHNSICGKIDSLNLGRKESTSLSGLFRVGAARTQYNLPLLNCSFSSIHNNIVEQPRISKEWQLSAKGRPFDHSIHNLRFNRCPPSVIMDIPVAMAPPEILMNRTSTISPGISNSLSAMSPVKQAQVSSLPFDNSQERGIISVSIGNTAWKSFGVKELCNLFTNYGNIELAITSADSQGFFLVYFSRVGANFAISCLNGAIMAGSALKVAAVDSDFLSRYLARHQCTCFSPRKRFSSKGPGLPNRVNPLSRTLHVTYHHDRDDRQLSEADLCQSLSHYGTITRIKRENTAKKRNMWFVEFSDQESAIKVLMKQHNKLLMGGTLRISFTKTI